MPVLAAILIGAVPLGLVAAAWGGYLYGRTVEQPERASAEEFAEELTAPPWTPPARPMPRYSHTERIEPLPPGVLGQPLGSRQPLLAQASVDRLPGYGRHARAENAPPLPVLVSAMRKYGPGITAEFNRIVEAQEVTHVGP